MTKQTEKKKATLRQHAPEYQAEALALTENVGVSQAANELGLHASQLYGWRTKAKADQDQRKTWKTWDRSIFKELIA